jgi:hypothetical protein
MPAHLRAPLPTPRLRFIVVASRDQRAGDAQCVGGGGPIPVFDGRNSKIVDGSSGQITKLRSLFRQSDPLVVEAAMQRDALIFDSRHLHALSLRRPPGVQMPSTRDVHRCGWTYAMACGLTSLAWWRDGIDAESFSMASRLASLVRQHCWYRCRAILNVDGVWTRLLGAAVLLV